MSIARIVFDIDKNYTYDKTYDDLFNENNSLDIDDRFSYVLYLKPAIIGEDNINEEFELDNPYLYVVSNFMDMIDAIKSDKLVVLLNYENQKLSYNENELSYSDNNVKHILQTGKEQCIEYVTQIINVFKNVNKWRHKIIYPYIYIANNNSQVCLKLGKKFKISEFNKILTILITSDENGYCKKFGNVIIECFRSLERPGLYIGIKQGKNMVNVLINRNDAYLLITEIIRDLEELA